MNKESIPLIIALIIPVLIVVFIFFDYEGKNLISWMLDYIPRINPLYYIVLVPFILGFIAAFLLYKKLS
ncbi:MAG: hypothetical protein QXS02_05070 [Candidatus Thermoplasmatota archaeon]